MRTAACENKQALVVSHSLLLLFSVHQVRFLTTRVKENIRASVTLCMKCLFPNAYLSSHLTWPMSKLRDYSSTYTNKYLIFCLHQRSFISGTDQQQINFTLPTQSKHVSISDCCEPDCTMTKDLRTISNLTHHI